MKILTDMKIAAYSRYPAMAAFFECSNAFSVEKSERVRYNRKMPC